MNGELKQLLFWKATIQRKKKLTVNLYRIVISALTKNINALEYQSLQKYSFSNFERNSNGRIFVQHYQRHDDIKSKNTTSSAAAMKMLISTSKDAKKQWPAKKSWKKNGNSDFDQETISLAKHISKNKEENESMETSWWQKSHSFIHHIHFPIKLRIFRARYLNP